MLAGALALTAAATLLFVAGGVLAALPSAVGLLLFAALVGFLERRVAVHHPHARLGLANRITLVRMAVAFLIACRALDPSAPEPTERWVLSTLAATALLLDGVDGWAARWQGLASVFGARFDLEVDAFLILLLAVVVVESGAVGPGCWRSARCAISISASRDWRRRCASRHRRARTATGAAKPLPWRRVSR